MSAIFKRRDMGLYEAPFFVGFWDRDYVSQLPCVMYYILLRAVYTYS